MNTVERSVQCSLESSSTTNTHRGHHTIHISSDLYIAGGRVVCGAVQSCSVGCIAVEQNG